MNSVPLPRPKAILFDWDNTLVSNWRCVVASINAALTAFNLPTWTEAESYERVRHSLRDSFPLIFGEDWPRARDIFYAWFRDHHIEQLEPLSGSAELLAALAERGIYLGVVSNKTGSFLRAEAIHLGWDRWFGRLVGATDCSADKPSIEPVLSALEPSGLTPGPHVWFVGDADIDMQCAHAAGCTPVLVGTTPVVGDGLERFPPALRLNGSLSISALVKHIDATIS